MVPDLSKTSLGLEYFCNAGDDLWNMADADLVELGKKELQRIGLAEMGDIIDGCVYRVPHAYPIYDSDDNGSLDHVREFVDSIENFQTIGRSGLHRYNNQDHSMITGMLAVGNLIKGEKNDLWQVNTDPTYHEEISLDEEKESEELGKKGTGRVFPRLDPIAFGFSTGLTTALLLFVPTLFLAINGDEVVGSLLHLLAELFPGFTVSLLGGLIGLLYLFVFGFVVGSGSAYLKNLIVLINARIFHRDIKPYQLKRLFEYL